MASGLRIVFFGTPEFAAFILRELARHGEHIAAVVTTPDKPQGRGKKIKPSAVKEAAAELGIPVLTPEKHRDPEFLAALRAFNADVFVVVAYKILPKEVFSIPRLGSFNIHASLLPTYRGAAPINWAIIRGEKETGITTFLLDEKVDTGQMLIAKSIPIGPDETAGELHDRLMALGAEAALETLQGMAPGTLHPSPQPNEGATSAPKLFPKDGEIDFHKPARDIHNFIRGLSPHPGATVILHGVRLKILRSRLPHDVPTNLQPGAFGISSDAKRLFAGTRDDVIEILELQREGKRAMCAEEFLRGNRSLFST
ncbi:MAG TPA: methionyl-tRNA formyltransferase [Candidatus Kapabacteria bacterium]|nr:methionyl-tRNA formyltransferase [Candidatus Kapabacteria bacterium]